MANDKKNQVGPGTDTTIKEPETPASEFPCGVTRQMIDGWKAEFPDRGVFLIKVNAKDTAGRDFHCFLRSPTRQISSASAAVEDPLKANEMLMQNCWITGDTEIQTVDYLFMSASAKLKALFRIQETEIKEL